MLRGNGGRMQAAFTVLGGVGLFLIGMKLMTDALRDAAGPGFRGFVERFTTTPLRGLLTGTAVTAAVQSSSATTVMTVGMVGAGVLTFPQALGVLYGANLGTTITGWMVAFLGVKLQVGLLAMPVLFCAALLVVLGRGVWARAARGVAGLCVVFIGLDLMQAGAGLAEGLITPDRLPGDTLSGRIILVVIGLLIVQVLQSSSAGMAMTLVFLAAGSFTFAQAAALVIGLNIGTTLTAILAALGGGRAARQTAFANVLFNLGTAALAFPFLDLVSPLLHGTALGADDLTALVLFHSGFNLLGAMVFLPLTGRFARLMDRLVAQDSDSLTAPLDPSLLTQPETALIAAKQVADGASDLVFAALCAALARPPDLRLLAAHPQRVSQALDVLEVFVARISLPEGARGLVDRHAALLHQMDHLQRLVQRLQKRSPLAVIGQDPVLVRAASALGAALRPGQRRDHLVRLSGLIERRARLYRTRTLLGRKDAPNSVQDLFDRTDAMRWLARLAEHAQRINHYRALTGARALSG